MKRKKGGKRPGAGRPRGSTKPENRIDTQWAYVMAIETIRGEAAREGRKCNPVYEAYVWAYVMDHRDKITLRDDGTIKFHDEKHFKRFCNTQKQLRSKGSAEFMAAFEREEAAEQRRRRR